MPPITRRTAIAGGLALAAAPALGGAALSASAMQADVALLRRAYGALHPGLHRYASPAEVAARFDRLSAAAVRPMGLAAFYLELSRFLGTIRCGHSYANFFNQAPPVQAALFDDAPRLPLHFLWLGAHMVVTADPFATGIAPGSEVLSIDGRPAATILAALMPFARADGGNDAKRRRLLSVQADDGYETFDVFHALRFGAGAAYRLEVAAPDGRRRTALVPAVTLAQRRAQARADTATADAPVWTMERRGPAMVLTMDGWGLYNSRWDWRGWLDAEMDRLVAERAPLLVVDIRRNEGGLDCGDALIARLADHPVASDAARRLVRYETLPADLRPHCDTWDRAFDRLGVGATRIDDRFLELSPADRFGATIAPQGPRYTGRVVVLTGPQNSSATFGFAQMVRRERLATLLGEPTGGNRRGINGGAFYFLRLPGTGLEVDLPLIGTFPAAAQPDAGIVPDIVVPVTRAAIAHGYDIAMARALT